MRVGGGHLGWVRSLAAFAAAAVVPLAMGQATPEPSAYFRSLPARADAMIIVKDAAAHRQSIAGQGLMEVLEAGGSLDRSRRAWVELAEELGWSSEQAFDALLGRRVTVLLRDLESDHGPDWALLTEVSPQSERRLRARLSAVPRRSAGDLAVLCIEDGAFEIAVARASASNVPDADRAVTVLIGPGGGSLFEELAPGLLTRPRLTAPQSADIVCMVRRPTPEDPEGFISVAATAREGGWRTRVIASPGAVLAEPSSTRRVWGDGQFRSVEREALLAVMAVNGSGVAPAYNPLWGLASGSSSLLGEREDGTDERSLIVLRRTGRPARTSGVILASGHMFPDALTDEAASSAELSLLVARETSDLHAEVVEGDRQVARLVASLQNGGAVSDHPLRMEVGVSDHETRLLPLAEMLASNPAAQDAIRTAFGPEPVLRWGITASLPHQHTRESGWWYASLTPAHGPRLPTPDALEMSFDRMPKRRISIGIVRPAELLRTIGGVGARFLAPLREYSAVESFRWDSWLRDDGLFEAEINIRFDR